MIRIRVNKQTAELTATEPLVSGSVNTYDVEFSFSDEWDDLSPTATFKAGDDKISVPLVGNVYPLPWEVLAAKNIGQQLYVGVYGVGDGEVVFPTTWVRVGVIRSGTEPGDNAEPPSPTVYEQFVSAIHTDAVTAESSAQSAAQDADTAIKEAARAISAAGVSSDAATLAQMAQSGAEAAESESMTAAQNADKSAAEALASKTAAEMAAELAQTAESNAAVSASMAETFADAAEGEARSSDAHAGAALLHATHARESEQNAKASEQASQQAASEAVSAWNNIRQQTVITAERTYPTAPQIDFTVTEATQALAFTDIGGVPLQNFNFAEMRFYCENAVQTAADASELRVALNRSSTAMYTAATEFLINTRQLYTSGGVSLKDGEAWTAAPQTNKAWRGAISTQIDPYLGYGRVVRSVNFWSNLSLIPVGTKIQVWLR